jgi:hypothetical protein
MSNNQDRKRNSQRRHQDQVKSARQAAIARSRGVSVTEPHRYVKQHAMDCGQPGCALCGNPRRIFQEPTVQERRFDQDVGEE